MKVIDPPGIVQDRVRDTCLYQATRPLFCSLCDGPIDPAVPAGSGDGMANPVEASLQAAGTFHGTATRSAAFTSSSCRWSITGSQRTPRGQYPRLPPPDLRAVTEWAADKAGDRQAWFCPQEITSCPVRGEAMECQDFSIGLCPFQQVPVSLRHVRRLRLCGAAPAPPAGWPRGAVRSALARWSAGGPGRCSRRDAGARAVMPVITPGKPRCAVRAGCATLIACVRLGCSLPSRAG